MTKINYPDLIRKSPTRNLRLEIRSPDNDRTLARDSTRPDRGFWGGFQSDFTYTVTNTLTGEVVWCRCPDQDDPLFSPNDAWVSDEGQVVVISRTPFSSGLFVLDQTGRTISHFDVATEVLENSDDEFHWTSAGPHWNDRGRGLCFAVDQRRYWSFRTLLNRQILIDLQQGKLISADDTVRRERQRVQRRWALSKLRAHADNPLLYGEPFAKVDWRLLRRLWTAIFWCGLDRNRRALPELRKCERSTIGGGYTYGWTVNGKSTRIVTMLLVRVTHFALRRMGEEPTGQAAYWLCRSGDPPKLRSRIPLPDRIADRESLLAQLQPGMTQQQVAELVGLPDVDGHAWFYDVSASNDEPYTLKVTWDHPSDTITEIQKIPPGWIRWKSRAIWL
jgi:hypothetical protein